MGCNRYGGTNLFGPFKVEKWIETEWDAGWEIY